MKTCIIPFILICFSGISHAQLNFEDQWKLVNQREKDGLTKSAAELVNSIYLEAQQTDAHQQLIKSLLYKSKYMLVLEEEAQVKIINQFKIEIANTASIPTRHLLENMLATLYWQYFQQNRNRFYQRTQTSVRPGEDFRTWDLTTLFNEVNRYYQRSLKDEKVLKNELLKNYNYLLIEGKNSKTFRPTLYDLLCHNALRFYKTNETSITQPSYKFVIDDDHYLSPGSDFIKLSLTHNDSLSLQLNALKIYQNLMKFHTAKDSLQAYVAIDIERLKFVKDFAITDTKDEVYLATLKESANRLNSSPLSSLYNFEIASMTRNQGNVFNFPGDDNVQYQWKLKEAVALCDEVIRTFPESEGAKKCNLLKQQILQPKLALRTEKFILLNTPSRILVTYKNLNELEFNIYKVDINQLKTYEDIYDTDEKKIFINTLKPIKTFTSTLKSIGDYQEHSTEITVPQLTNGLYLIKADTKKNDVFALTQIQVTNFALLESTENDLISYQLIHRNHGRPIEKALIRLSYKNNKNKSFNKTLSTDRFGKFSFKKDRNYYRSVKIKVDFKDEVAFFGDYYISKSYKSHQNKEPQYEVFLFTDRSIYRPGQTLYFKGIATVTKNNNTKVYANEKALVQLRNVNDDVVKELELKTNEYGSVSGEFILPSDGLTGNYTIEMFCGDEGYSYFSVEDYKRPKFKTEFQPIRESYKVNDSITVKGKALAFAGSNITNAKVVYRVKRQVQYPNWWYWRRPSSYNSEAQEITFGEEATNEQGEFEITFKALPDEKVSKESLAVFSYEVTADVTDINGETRSATTLVNVGYHTMTLQVSVPNQIDKSKKEIDIRLNSKNLNGEVVSAKGTLAVYKLNAPGQVLRDRPWNAPDFQVISKEEFKRLFPHDPYSDEHLLFNWENGDKVFSTDFNTENEKTVTIKKLKKWQSGHYLIVAQSQDNFGQAVKAEAYMMLVSNSDKAVADNQLFEVSLDKDRYNPGDIVKLTLGSAAEDISITVEIKKGNDTLVTQLVQLNNSKQTINIPVRESDLGGFEVYMSFAAYNSYVAQGYKVNVPYPETDLEIETTTFRDKLQPGQSETWSFKIKGPKGDKVSAELLASMYDASLDEFKAHNWNFSPIQYPNYYSSLQKNGYQSFGTTYFRLFNRFKNISIPNLQSYDQLNWFGFYFGNNYGYLNKRISALDEVIIAESQADELEEISNTAPLMVKSENTSGLSIGGENTEIDGLPIQTGSGAPGDAATNPEAIAFRKNLQETAFFYPTLKTDAEGNISFNFKAPEALTKWKLQLLAHTKTLKSTTTTLETITQKELMVIPNAPRFLRQDDEIVISTKIANLTTNVLSGQAKLELTDAISGENMSSNILADDLGIKSFSVNENGNTSVTWRLRIPEGIQALQYKVLATTGDFSDGEQSTLPVLSNRMMVTETLPMWIRANERKNFTLEKLKSNRSNTLKNHKLTLEITSNPAWYALQALPYLMEYPYDCNEQTFARYYANVLAHYIVKSNSRIEAVFNQWKSQDALLSNLEKNQELKSLLIQETPWLRDAQSETEQKKRIGLLFDLNKMTNELQSAHRQLKNNQLPSGAWAWFKGGYASRYITQHILAGLGHLKHLGIDHRAYDNSMVQNALAYLDAAFIKEFEDLKRRNKDIDLTKNHLSYLQLHYLYIRSFYPELNASDKLQKVIDYYKNQIEKYWLNQSLYAKGLMALTMFRMEENRTATKILKSLKENSITSEELGMYWKENTNSWHWYQAPIETQALLIEAFSEIENDKNSIDNLKIWLLKNKQTNQWKTTKATTEAVYALLLQGSDWLSVTEMVNMKVGSETISPKTLEDVALEAGTGYYKTSWTGSEISPEMGAVTVDNNGEGIAWGSLYWQYFEDLDKITSTETPLNLNKKLFLKSNTDKGEMNSEITPETRLKVGDLVRVRIELRTDRPMEFVHLKDMRAAGLEPINVISQYKWQDGLGYYESTKDAATNFFIDYLPKGIYVFEYDLRINNSGDMSNGISTVQSMYAPEFSSHSEGIRVSVKR